MAPHRLPQHSTPGLGPVASRPKAGTTDTVAIVLLVVGVVCLLGGLGQCGVAALAKVLAPKAMEFVAPGGKVRPGGTISVEEKKGPFITVTREYKPGDAGYEQARQQLEAGMEQVQDEMPQRIAAAWATGIGAALIGGVLFAVGIVRMRRAKR